MTKLERLKERYSSNGEEIVCAIRIRQLIEEIERLKAALERLALIGPPSKSCFGDEWASVCLKDNCKLANETLAESNERWG